MNVNEIIKMGTNPDITLVGGSIKGAVKEAGGSSSDLWKIPRSAIEIIDDFNIRIVTPKLIAHRRALADNMKEEGFKPNYPLSGFVQNEGGKSRIFLTGGHNRLAAYDMAIAEGAELGDQLPMVLVAKGTSLEDLTAEIGSGNESLPLEIMEKALLCKRQRGFGWDNERIAKRLGFKTPAYVEDLLLLAGAPANVIELVAFDKVAAAVAIDMLKKHGSDAAKKLEEGLAVAKGHGKEKLTKRFTVDPGQKFVVRQARPLFDAVEQIAKDPGFNQLDAALRDKVTALLSGIAEQKDKASKPKAPKAPKAPKEAAVPKSKAPKATFVSRPKQGKGAARAAA